MGIIKYLYDHILGLSVRKNIFFAPIFGFVWFMIFMFSADFIAELVQPQLAWFTPDEEIRINIVTSLTLTAFYLVFGMMLIYQRRIQRSFFAWLFLLLAVAFGFFRVTHVMAAICVAMMSMIRGSNPFDPELRERAIHGEEVSARASRPPPDIRRPHKAMQRHRSHNVVTEHPVVPAEQAKFVRPDKDDPDQDGGKDSGKESGSA